MLNIQTYPNSESSPALPDPAPPASAGIIVVLVNRALPYNCVGKVSGYSGVEYGHSIFEEAHGAHVCRMPLDQWRACKQDVALGAMRRWSQWEMDIEWKDEGLANVASDFGGTGSGRRSLGPPQRIGGGDARAEETVEDGGAGNGKRQDAASTCGGHTRESLGLVTNFRTLLRLARAAGVAEAERFDNTPALREAILARQLAGGPGTDGSGSRGKQRTARSERRAR